MESIKIDRYNQFPEEFINSTPSVIRSIFPNPSIIEIPGRSDSTLFLSFLLHGNEHTSFYTAQEIAKYCQNNTLEKKLFIFIGNVFACEKNRRYLDGQKDYNRIWGDGKSPEHEMAKSILNEVKNRANLFASIDVHNNTGTNPLYSCISCLDAKHVYLASLFSKQVVYFHSPNSAQSVNFSNFTPSLTLECGKTGNMESVSRVFQFILDVLRIPNLQHKVPTQDVEIYQTKARMEIHSDVTFSFKENPDVSLVFPSNFENLNFFSLEQGEKFAFYKGEIQPIYVFDDNRNDMFHDYFFIDQNQIYLKRDIVPSMLTMNAEIIRQDCLGYLMEKITLL